MSHYKIKSSRKQYFFEICHTFKISACATVWESNKWMILCSVGHQWRKISNVQSWFSNHLRQPEFAKKGTAQDLDNDRHDMVQAIAVRDRVNCQHLSDADRGYTISTARPDLWILSKDDYGKLQSIASHIIKQIICKQMGYFKESYTHLVPKHLEHKYQKEMNTKSTIVSITANIIHVTWPWPEIGTSTISIKNILTISQPTQKTELEAELKWMTQGIWRVT